MFSRDARLTTIAAVTAAVSTSFIGSPIAHATEPDDQFHAVIADLGLQFGTPDQAVEAGNNVCDIVAEGSANNISPAEIRSSLINSLLAEGLDAAGAAQFTLAAVNTYCPNYSAVVIA